MPRSHCKIANNMKKKSNISLLKSMNPIICNQRKYNLDEAQDMGFKEQLKA